MINIPFVMSKEWYMRAIAMDLACTAYFGNSGSETSTKKDFDNIKSLADNIYNYLKDHSK